MTLSTRRRFIQTASSAAGVAWVAPSIARVAEGLTSLLNGVPTRQTLTGGWEFLRMPLAGPWEVWSDQALAPWAPVSLPHCFNSYDGCDPDVPAYRGKGWYRRVLHLENPFPNGRTLLHVEGAGQSSEIYVGDSLGARHSGGYDEFVVDITALAAHDSGKTRLSILCDNSPDLDRMPADLSDFTLYGGLYRNVHLLYVPQVSLERVSIRVNAGPDRPTHVTVQGRLYNPERFDEPVTVGVTVKDSSGVEVHRSSQRLPVWTETVDIAHFDIAGPNYWSPANPELYRCDVVLTSSAGISTHAERFGVRYFEFKDKGPFLLNGRRLLIQGTHRHEDHAQYAAAMPEDAIRQEMLLIKEMGANFIRLAHYQQRQLVLDLCDELGLLVWEEVPWCRAGIGNEVFRQHGRDKLSAMIDQHLNHPSVICWGLGNEDDWPGEYPSIDESSIRDYMVELHTLAHRLDPSRVTSYRRGDFVRDIPDVYSPSIWAGWYGGRFVDYERSLQEQRERSARMLHVEWGADSHARRHAEEPYKLLSGVTGSETAETGLAYLSQGGTARVSRDGDWSETYACDLFDWHLKVQQSLPWLSGAVQWVFKDFTTPLRSDNPLPRINQKGVVERDMTKKESFYVFQSYWAEKPMVHIYGHTWPIRWGRADQARRVRIYSNCPSVELFLNGVSLGVRKRDIQDFPCAGLRWDTPFAVGRNSLRAVALTSGGQPIGDELSFHYQTESWGAPAQLRLAEIERDLTGVVIEATLHDSKGVPTLDARNVVRFGVTGIATMQDNRGTATGSRVLQLYNGRARIRVLANRGEATASVSSNGIKMAFLPL